MSSPAVAGPLSSWWTGIVIDSLLLNLVVLQRELALHRR
jgi:hypothetical protein